MKTLISILIILTFQCKAQISPAKIENIHSQNSYSNDVLIVTFDEPLQRTDSKNISITVEPLIECYWSWIDQYNLACNLNDFSKYETEENGYDYNNEQSLTLATQYVFTLNEGLIDLQDRKVSPQTKEFNYKRPSIVSFNIQEWTKPNFPLLAIKFNQITDDSDIYSKLFLKTDNQSIPMEKVSAEDLKKLTRQNFKMYDSRYILAKPSQNLDLNKEYKISTKAGIKSLRGGSLESIGQELNRPLQAVGDFKFIKYTCTYGSHTYQGPCYSDDRMQVYFSSILNQNSLYKCSKYSDKKKWYIRPNKNNNSILTINSNDKNQAIISECLHEITDIFSRKLTHLKNSDLPKIKGIRPSLTLNSSNYTLIPHSQATNLRVTSINLDSYYVTYEQVNNETFNTRYKVVVEEKKGNYSVGKKLQLPLPENQIHSIKGYVSILEKTEDKTARIPFHIQKSPYQVNIKQNLNTILLQVNDINNSNAIINAEVIIDYEGAQFKSITDKNGISEIKINDLVGESDFALTINQGKNSISYPRVHNFSNTIYKKSDNHFNDDFPENSFYSFGLSDKPIYRAGETVNYIIYLRQKRDIDFIIPNVTLPEFKLALSSNLNSCYQYNECHSSYILENPQVDDFGGISGKFTLPKSSRNGEYSLKVLFKNKKIISSHDVLFQVSDFKNSEYKLNLSSPIKYVKSTEAFPVIATAEYYSGGKVPNEKGEIAGEISSKSISAVYPEFQSFTFGETDYRDYESYFLKDLTYDSNGVIKTNYTPPKNNIKFGSIKLNAGLKPKAGEWNYSQDLILSYRQQDYFLGLKLKSWSNSINEEIQLDTVFIDYLGKKHQSKSIEFFIQHKTNNLWTEYKKIDCINKSKSICAFNLDNKGLYKIKAIATKKKINFEQELSFYVSDRTFHKNTNTRPKISIQSDKKKYAIGDKAIISIYFPENINKALITTERNNILDQWSLQTDNGYLEIELPISKKHAPGFDVTVLNHSNNELNSLYVLRSIDQESLTIRVDSEKENKLFEIESDKEIYLPKEKVKLNINSLSDFKSEYTVAVIDQSIIDLIDSKLHYDLPGSYYNESRNYWDLYNNYQISDSNKYYYHQIKLKKTSNYLKNQDSNNLVNQYSYYDEEELEELSPIVATGSRIQREDLGVSPSQVKGQSKKVTPHLSIIRENAPLSIIENLKINPKDLRYIFAESAFFKTRIQIGEGLDNTIEIPLPDNITQWRIIVFGTDKSGKLEFNDLSVKASKDLELRSTLPVQLTEDDQFVAQYSVVSKKSRKVNIQTSVQAKQKDSILETSHLNFTKVKELNSKTIELPVANISQGNLELTALAKTKNKADGLFQKIPVRSNTTELSISQHGQFNSIKKTIDISKPKHLYEDSAIFSLQISNSLMPYLQPVYAYMDKYIHACWEQQSAKAIVYAIQLESSNNFSKTELNAKKQHINSIINQAYDFQAPNGGMTFFNTDNGHVNLFLSLNTLSNFTFLQQLGYEIPKPVKNNLTDFVETIITDTEDLPSSIYRYKSGQLAPQTLLKAYRYANQENIIEKSYNKETDREYLNAIKQKPLENLSDQSLAALTQLLYIYKEDSKNLKPIIKAIQNKFYSNNKKYFMKDSNFSPWYLMPSQVKDHCELVTSLLNLDSQLISKDDVIKHINGVLEYRNPKGEFGNTLENSVCSQALFTFSNTHETPTLEINYKLNINDEVSIIKNGFIKKRITLDNNLNISIENPNHTQSYFSSQLIYKVQSDQLKEQIIGFNIQREYFIFNQGSWELAESFKVGDWVKTRLTIHTPISRKFVAISDPVPGAWLPTDPKLARNMPVGMRKSLKHFDNSGFFYERQLNPATTRFYADYLPAGSHRISYLSQIRSEGDFSALPAIVEEMYDDENRANTELLRIKVGPDK